VMEGWGGVCGGGLGRNLGRLYATRGGGGLYDRGV